MDDEEFRELTHELGGLTHFVHQVIQKSNLDLFKIHEHNRTIQKDVMAAEASVAHAVNKIAEREQDAREEQQALDLAEGVMKFVLTADQTEEKRAKCLAQFREACRELLQRQRVMGNCASEKDSFAEGRVRASVLGQISKELALAKEDLDRVEDTFVKQRPAHFDDINRLDLREHEKADTSIHDRSIRSGSRPARDWWGTDWRV
jgi:hypothetical protein